MLKEQRTSKKINSTYSENGLPNLVSLFAKGDSDAAYVTQAGIPCIDSIGVEGGRIHTGDEFSYLKLLKSIL